MAFKELYKIRPFLKNENLRFRFALIDMEEYRLLNGWSKDKKKGSERYDACTDCASDSDGFRNRGQSGKTGE